MASITLTGSYSGLNASNYGIRCVCSSTSNGSTANTSNVTVTLQMRRAVNTGYEGQWNIDGSATARIIIVDYDSGTSSVTFDTRNSTSWITLKTYTVNNIPHAADGTKTIGIKAYFEPNATSTLYGGYVSGTFVLDTIPRATTPTISATSVTMGNSINITLTPASTSFKHKVRYDFGSLTGQTNGLSIGAEFTAAGNTTVTFTPPTSLGNQIPNALSGTCTIYCYTYNSSGTQIGSAITKTLTLNVPSYTPSASFNTSGNNLLSGTYVQGKSTVTVNIYPSTSYGASIKSIVSTVDGKTYTTNPFTSSVLSAGSKTVSIVITDSRNKVGTLTSSSFTVYEYAVPYITSFSVERMNDETTVVATLVGGVSSVNSKNSKAFKVTLNGVTQTISSSSYTVNGTTTFTNVPTDYTLTAKAEISDHYTYATKDATLPTVEVTLDYLYDGKGIAMGKVAETTDLLDVAWNQRVRKNLSVDGNLTVGGKSIKTDSHPVGTVFIRNTNTSPADLFGGTWRLIDKNYSALALYYNDSNISNYITASSAASISSFSLVRHNTSIFIRIYFTNSVAFSDTSNQIGTLKLNSIGMVSPAYLGIYGKVATSDGGNGIIYMEIDTNGVITTTDVNKKDGSSEIAANNGFYFEFTYEVPIDKMIDSHCDKFYWERTA